MRVVDFAMDGISVKLASMTWAQAEKFVEEGQALLARTDVQPTEWLNRTLNTVASSMLSANRNGAEEPDNVGYPVASQVKETYDMPTINAMYFKILEISGLAASKQGEVRAA